jgi:hypothetical protein
VNPPNRADLLFREFEATLERGADVSSAAS